MRLVLDTNIMVSIYLYADPRHSTLREHYVNNAGATLLLDAVCYEELAHVMRSEQFATLRAERGVDVEALLITIADEGEWVASAVPQGMPSLPICRDPDDQKFLHLAARGGAHALLTYDKALLKCRGRVPYAIMRPEEFAKWERARAAGLDPSH
jgi:putative PIN family toxin of toxin-antitoxin system